MAIEDPELILSLVDPTVFYMNRIIPLAFILLFISTVPITGFVKPFGASGTIYIKADGSVYPSTAGMRC